MEFRKQHSTEQQGFSGVMSQYRNREQENREKRASNKNNRAGKNGKPDKVIGGGFEVDRKVAILPAHVLNSEAPALGRQLPSHKVRIRLTFKGILLYTVGVLFHLDYCIR